MIKTILEDRLIRRNRGLRQQLKQERRRNRDLHGYIRELKHARAVLVQDLKTLESLTFLLLVHHEKDAL